MPNVGTKTITTGSGGGTTSLAIKRRVRGVTTMKVGQSEQVPVGTRMLGSPAKSGRKGSLK
jgi:hypothetical protein